MRIHISFEAGGQMEQIADYLEINWSSRIRENFLQKLENALHIISQMPMAFPESIRHVGLRRCVVQKYTSVYYRVKNNEIDVLAVVDNRQDF